MKQILLVASLSLASLAIGAGTPQPARPQTPEPNKRMWVIFAKEELKNPNPGTWGAEMPISEWYYDASSVRSIGTKRFAEINFCGYKNWKPGEPTNGRIFCKLEERESLIRIVGIDCKSNAFQVASGLNASPKWEKIKSGHYSALKMQLCGN